MKTVGELYDALKLIESAEKDVEEAERSLRFGGNADTMKRKQEMLQYAQRMLEMAREELL